MWVRRNEDEIVRIERARRIRKFNPLPAALLTIGLLLVVAVLGWPPPARIVFDRPTRAIILFLIVFTSFYLSKIFIGRYWLFGPPSGEAVFLTHSVRNMICSRCQTVQADREAHLCPCGRELEELHHWRWVDDGIAE